MKSINVGLLGFGTVGSGVFKVMVRNQQEIARRIGRIIKIDTIGVRDVDLAKSKCEKIFREINEKNHNVKSEALKNDLQDFFNHGLKLKNDFLSIVNDQNIDIIVEAIGGIDDARKWILEAIKNGKHVVTANKALLARHGTEIFHAAKQHGVNIAFEAAVAGGIPIIKVLREGLSANRIHSISGIINGTTNFILSEMMYSNLDLNSALARAQELGYAEADVSADVDGLDAAHKITLMSAIAFGTSVNFDEVYIEGIRGLNSVDINYAKKLGYAIKLLGVTKRLDHGIELRVHPVMLPKRSMLAKVDGVMNAIVVDADAVGRTMYYGKGAGSEPTASAVVADLVDVARLFTAQAHYHVPPLAFQSDLLENATFIHASSMESAFYVRLQVIDRLGVLAQLSNILLQHKISVDRLWQIGANGLFSREGENEALDNQDVVTDLIIITHPTVQGSLEEALKDIADLPLVKSNFIRIRIDDSL